MTEVTVSFNDDNGECIPPMVNLHINNRDLELDALTSLQVDILLSDFGVVSEVEWNNLQSSLTNNQSAHVTFCNSNGEVSICTHNNVVTFTVSKDGAGGDGQITVSLHALDCVRAFKLIHDTVWPNK